MGEKPGNYRGHFGVPMPVARSYPGVVGYKPLLFTACPISVSGLEDQSVGLVGHQTASCQVDRRTLEAPAPAHPHRYSSTGTTSGITSATFANPRPRTKNNPSSRHEAMLTSASVAKAEVTPPFA